MIRWKDDRPNVEVYDPAIGKKRYVKPSDHGMTFRGLTGRRKLEAAAKKLEQLALDEIEQRRPGATRTETCDSFATRWPDDFPGRGDRARSESTRIHNRGQVDRFARDFEGVALRAFSREDAIRFAQTAPSRVPALRAMFNDAMDAGLVDSNPFSRLGLAQSQGRKDIVVLTVDEVQALADTAVEVHGEDFGGEVAAAIVWAAYTCCRPGETYAAKYSHLQGDMYDLVEQWNSRLRKTTAPKVGSDGVIFVPEQARRAVLNKPRRLDDDLMFRTVRGKQFSAPSWLYSFAPVRDTFVAQLDRQHDLRRRLAADPKDKMDFHELRHFGASHMLNDLGIDPWVIAEQLRHSDGGQLVTSLYGHPSRKVAIERMRAAYGENVQPLRDVSGENVGRRKADGA